MGYTHYFTQQRGITNEEWAAIMKDAKEILAATMNSGIKLAWEFDAPNKMPEVSEKRIRFNGIGGGGHETFLLPRTHSSTRGDFCKTARKPYDVAVGAILLSMNHRAPGGWSIGSDGDLRDDEWNKACDLYRKALNKGEDIIQADFLKS
jgi:hypothetical protein